ncbi:DUF4062 domain-containing protein [Pseudonocardia sulfidoxydans]|uniref:DUF4062 domain-containing protein n=1 Tax=Pseudonocardia sulfidoxydans TaxID=54011 RepID=UPI001649FB69|nr:DUF4062 domain-containing protein [Pseudonocardia sulfidoxydans]
MKVFVSSVRRGLEVERDSLPGYIRSVGHTPVVFEDFTAQPIPSRQVCLEAVAQSDAYVLLIGPLYGDVMPDTGLSPTEEEFIAARTKGLPILVFHKMGVSLEPRQVEFADTVEKYAHGSFRGEFLDANDLRIKVGSALEHVEQNHQKLEWFPRDDITPLPPVLVRTPNEYRPLLVLTLAPVPRARLSTMQLRGIAQRAERVLREIGSVPQSSGLESTIVDDGSVVVRSSEQLPRSTGGVTGFTPGGFGGVSASPSGQVAAWQLLPRDFAGSLVDHDFLRETISKLLRLIGQLEAIPSDLVTPYVSIAPADGVRQGSPGTLGQRSSGQLSLQQGRVLETKADDCLKTALLASAADEIADELAQRILEILSRFH